MSEDKRNRLSEIMRRGHKLAKKLLNEANTYKDRLSLGLKLAWKEFKEKSQRILLKVGERTNVADRVSQYDWSINNWKGVRIYGNHKGRSCYLDLRTKEIKGCNALKERFETAIKRANLDFETN